MNNENVRFLKPLLRGFPIVVLAMIIAVLAAKKYLNYVTPMYESTAKLKLADTQEGVPSANLFKDFDVFATPNKISTEIEVLKSTSLIEKTLEKLPFSTEIYRKGKVRSVELFNDSPIKVESILNDEKNYDKKFIINVNSNQNFTINSDSAKEIKGTFGVPTAIKGGKILITKNDSYLQSKPGAKIVDQYEVEFLSREKLLDKVNKNLDIVSVDKDVPVIRINYKSNVPEKASLLVNTLAETYIQDYIENKYRAANTTVDFLKNEIGQANNKLSGAENRIENYRNKENIINIPQETETDLRKISQLKIQKSNLKMNLDAIKNLNNYISEGKDNYLELAPNFEAFNDLLSTEMVKNMKLLQAEKKELLLTYTPEHEKVKIIDAKIKDLTDYQTESIKNTQKNLQIKYNDIDRDIQVAEQAFIGLPEKEKLLNIMNREFNLYEKNYNFLNEKRIDAEIAKAAKISFHKIITRGELPKQPVSPMRSIIIIVAAIMSMIGSIALIYAVHFAKAKVNDVYTIEKNSTIPVAFTTPYIKNRENIMHHFLENVLEMELKEIIKDKNLICITSYDKSKQHMFHSKNIIKALQAQSRKVLVIDVAGNLENIENIDYIDFSEEKNLRLTSTDIENLIREKMTGNDLCIINNQSIKQGKLPLLFLKMADENLFVLDSRKTAEKTIMNVELLKDEYKLTNLWFVLNKEGYNPSLMTSIKSFINRKRS
ncbi:Wzz/FepE/Etk N-terminal domain-containing protein [Chryseobacterium sp. APV1]|uniref:Wzz/FepE/Etk N-terminal domain-containing protein n=1 Tax=Chryseobacterium urinae TaxID=3058400 RepID=A0ABT8U016_9FLAO|nr:Wzz/FepE/Etk N-terminal domain-containing protein [Chryseobacterium sp. APV1]MDO3424399.1 Wzz/FepE/Etk N-terminal domain-containing protein [Chryseobacterium sp. APV1]